MLILIALLCLTHLGILFSVLDSSLCGGFVRESESEPDEASEPEEEWVDDNVSVEMYMDDVEDQGPEDHISVAPKASKQSMLMAKWLSLFLLKLQAAHQITNGAMNALFWFLSAFLLFLSLVYSQLKEY